jgi:hypothetical protein
VGVAEGLNSVLTSVSDPDPVGSAFKLGLDPGSGSVFGIRIQMSKNRLKKPKFTVIDFKDENSSSFMH